jgi:ubiquinol-cytochrome c reductase cytochrome c1 subunit
MKKHLLLIATSLISLSSVAYAGSGHQKEPHSMDWSFDGVFGTVDKQSAQRGLQVYKEVCSACHSLNRIAFRNLEQLGFSEAEVKALAASYQIQDGPNDDGEMFQRPGLPSDHFVAPYANDNAARSVHGGALPPDLSLITKARVNGPNYIHSLLVGYEKPPAEVHLADGQHYNPYYPSGIFNMAAPLSDGQVTYEDGTVASAEQMSIDVVNFLQWAAEPEMEDRKKMGLKVMLYLAIFTVFMYIAKRNVWKKLH